MSAFPDDMPGWLIYILIGAVLLAHRFLLSTRRQAWWGALLPTIWVVVVIVSTVQGRHPGVGDWIRDAVVFLALVGMAVTGRETTADRRKRRAAHLRVE